ncbi:MAG TPA: DUF4350 domain-containing protein [Thermoguttaceae bacterium]|nr:DUF4350 domain-containing protein [Thermoguttaceae bacterium]
MNHHSSSKLLGVVCLLILFVVSVEAAAAERIHCVTDISHTFSFYFDGRFGTNYVAPDGIDVRNWGTLHKYDLADANLLILQSSASPCRYTPEDIEAVRSFLAEGGGVVVLGDFALFREEETYHPNTLLKPFGARFVDVAAQKPLQGEGDLEHEDIASYSPKTITLDEPDDWRILVEDARGRVVMANKAVGKGQLLVASRGLCGHNPNASDPINDQWLRPLLRRVSAGKQVDPSRRPQHQMPENLTQRDRLPVRYSDYMKPYADAIYEVYDQCFPVIEEIMGVPPSEGMLTSLILLPTGGGGFSSGANIGLAAWWGNFPEKRYGMVELITHESVHSWVHPFPEPIWNEGIATYVGILTGMKLGLETDAQSTLDGWIAGAKRYDPNMDKLDLVHGENIPHVVRMAKPMWIFEQLRKEKPDVVTRYFQTKRKLATRDRITQYTADDSIVVLSIAMQRDLFPWFRSLGITVDSKQSQLATDRAFKDVGWALPTNPNRDANRENGSGSVGSAHPTFFYE